MAGSLSAVPGDRADRLARRMATLATDLPESIDPRTRDERLAEAHAAIGDPSRPLLWCDGPGWAADVVVSGALRLWGWALHSDGPAEVDVRVDDGPAQRATGGLERADVAAAYPDVPRAELGGWALSLDLDDARHGPRVLTITARDGQGVTTT